MVILETTFKELNKAVKRKLTKKELDETLFSLGFELESVENDNLKIEITPDRPDLLSTQGLARLLKAYLGKEKGLVKYKIKKSDILFFLYCCLFLHCLHLKRQLPFH